MTLLRKMASTPDTAQWVLLWLATMLFTTFFTTHSTPPAPHAFDIDPEPPATDLASTAEVPPGRTLADSDVSGPDPTIGRQPYYRARFVTNSQTPRVHAATATSLPDGTLLCFWYAGTREGAADVAIYAARLDPAAEGWSEPWLVMDRHRAQTDLDRYIRKIGNPVIYLTGGTRTGDASIWLFYVTVSVGGWAGSAINLTTSDDGGKTWSRSKRLVTSPFFNISTLVKSAPFRLRDGSIGLPVYHEFLGKFGELVTLGPDARVLGKQRLSAGKHSLQPVVVPVAVDKAVSLMRYAGASPRRILHQTTADGGRTWSVPTKLALPNPNAAVSAVRVVGDSPFGELLLAYNDSESNRSNLSLAASGDLGFTWTTRRVIEDEDNPTDSHAIEFSYPWLMHQAGGDRFDLFYTWYRKEIRHVQFNRAWLERGNSRP